MSGAARDESVSARARRATGWLDHGGILVAGIATAHCAATGALLGFEVGGALLLLAASGTFLVYYMDRVVRPPVEDRVNRPDRVAWIEAHPGFRRTAPAVAAGLAIVAASRLPADVLAIAGTIGVVGSLHRLPVLTGRRLKDYPYAKPLLISAAWAAGAVLLPIVEAGLHPVSISMVLLGLGRLLYVAANVLLCDLYDRPGDTRAIDLPETLVRRWAAGIAIAGAALVAGCAAVAPLQGLWLFDAGGPVALAGAALAGDQIRVAQRPLVLDALVAWPVLTVLLAAV